MPVTADVWDELAEPLGDTIAAELRAMVVAFDASRERTLQDTIGPSGIGSPCSRCLARGVLGCPIERGYDFGLWARFLGIAGHALLAEAALHHNIVAGRGRYVIESKVYPDNDLMPKGGESDLFDEDRFVVVDHKIVNPDKLKKYREANDPGIRYKRQAHVYGRGFKERGKRVDHVAVAFWPRGSTVKQLWVWTEPYDEAVVDEALERYRTIRALALSLGVSVLPQLPADESCFDCGGAPMTEESA